jgi:GTP-binding protein
LFGAIDRAYAAAMSKLSTPRLTRELMAATAAHQPPMNGLSRPKLRYAHQGGHNPPVVVVHGSGIGGISEDYRRYLENRLRDAFKLKGTPLRVELRQGSNPFAGRKNAPLTASQERKKRRDKIRAKRLFAK